MDTPTAAGITACACYSTLSNSHVLFAPVDTVREIYARWGRRDLAAVFELLSPDVEIFQTTALPWGGRFRDFRGALGFFAGLNHYVDGAPEGLTYIAAGEEVAVTGRFRGTARASRTVFDVEMVHVWTVQRGKVSRWEACVDTPAMCEALGGA